MLRWVMCLVSIAVASAAVDVSPAAACSWPAQAIASSIPEPDAVGVPIDVAPIIRGHWTRESLRWETADGYPVEFDLEVGESADFTEGQAAELKATEPLQPDTEYVIRAETESGEAKELKFTTGSSATEARTLRQPDLDVRVFTGLEDELCSVGPAVGCFSTDAAMLIEITDAEGKVLVRDVIARDIAAFPSGSPHCIRAFERDASGRLSAAAERCGSELRARRAPSGGDSACEFELPDAGAEDESDSDAVCAAIPGLGRGNAWVAIGLLAVLGALLRGSLRGIRRA